MENAKKDEMTGQSVDFSQLNITASSKFIRPLQMRWKPQEDISIYELSQCIPYLLRIGTIMPTEIDKAKQCFRHFDIYDPN